LKKKIKGIVELFDTPKKMSQLNTAYL